MDEDERKKKLEAGKAKFASFKKKRSSKKKKSDTPVSTPRDASHSEEVGAGDSIAVQTGDDNSVRALSPYDESDNSTTTADDISTEEEGSYGLGLTAVERIQELELTVSDQQVALQKLTLENKDLHDKTEAALLEKSIVERDNVINELQKSVKESANHVRQLQQQLVKTTDAVMDTEGEQGQVVAELTETRKKLDEYQIAMIRQEEALQQMARKLEEKSIEAGEAIEKCESLRIQLDKSQNASSEESISGSIGTMQEQLKQEKEIRSQLEEEHHKKVASMGQEMKNYKEMEEAMATTYDPDDVQAYREQVALMRSQLETAYRDIDKLKRDHDKEVIQLNQQLVGTVDEYETKLQDERTQCEEMEHRLEMSDTVSFEIQASFSKQLEQLQEERDTLRQQLRQAQTRVKENSASKKQIKDLQEEVVSYQTELAETSNQLEDADKKKRKLLDDMQITLEECDKIKLAKSALEQEYENIRLQLTQQTNDCDVIRENLEEKIEEIQNMTSNHAIHVDDLEKKNVTLKEVADKEKISMEEEMKKIKKEHSEELKDLHSQHHRQMDELKREMEEQLESTKCSLNEERKEQLENVKEVHERSRDREIMKMNKDHDDAVKRMKEEMKELHEKEIKDVKIEAKEMKSLSEERLRIELKEDFDSQLEKELSILRRGLEHENEMTRSELEEKFEEELLKLKSHHQEELETYVSENLKKQNFAHEEVLSTNISERDNALKILKDQYEDDKNVMETEHRRAIEKLKAELVEIQNNRDDKMLELNDVNKKLQGDLEEAQAKVESLQLNTTESQEQFKINLHDVEGDYQRRIDDLELALANAQESREREQDEMEREITSLKDELFVVQNERDQIFAQAERSQKNLAALHHEESVKMQEELDQVEADHQEKTEQMQLEIDSLRTSRNDLQDLRNQLMARSSSVEDMERMQEEFNVEKEKLMKERKEELEEMRETLINDHKEEVERIRLEHEEEVRLHEEKMEQVLTELNESREKLEEVTSSSVQLESSPMRSLSAMSDYDSSNVAALNKDYRSALTLTNIADVSGLSEPLEEVAKQNVEESQLENMKKEMEELRISHEENIEKIQDENRVAIKEITCSKDEERDGALEEKKNEYMQKLKEAQDAHNEAVDKLNEAHRHDMLQIRLQCASDTAKQIEEEVEVMRENLKVEFQSEMDSLKHQMELESNETLVEERQKHAEELEEQSNQLSSSMEIRIAALMSELHEQKQEVLKRTSSDHQEELKKMQEEFDLKMKEAAEREDEANNELKKRRETLEADVERLINDLERSKSDYKKLIEDLDDGSHGSLRILQTQHEEDVEKLRMKLEIEHDERQENALRKQALIFEQAQSDFMKLHEEQLEKFIVSQKESSEIKAKEIEKLKEKLLVDHEDEKKVLVSTHDEEMKVVANKLVEIDGEKQKLEEIKGQLVYQIEYLQAQKEKELSEMKTTLVDQHMTKFQELTTNLDQLHREEVEKMMMEHRDEEGKLREGLIDLQRMIDEKESSLDEAKLKMLQDDEKLKQIDEDYQKKIKEIQDEHEFQLQQIDEEIQKQDEDHKESMKKILSSQSEDLDGLQKQFDEALSKATEASIVETQNMAERVVELESELQSFDEMKSQLEEMKERKDELESVVEERKVKMEAWEEERMEEREAYERKLNELSETLDGVQEDYKDLSARIEFERAEYEAEIESVQDDARNKDDNIKELEAEVEHKTAALDSLLRQHEMLNERRERETLEGDNLLKMLRDDLDRLNKERDSACSANEQLLATISEVVRANQQCEDIIAKRWEDLPIMGADDARSTSSKNGAHSDNSTPINTSLSESFVDEGLDLSQRLAESMFSGPELDPAAREVVTSAGVRVGQAVDRVMDMLENTIKQLNASQQAQTMLGDELQRVVERDDDNNNEQTSAKLQETQDVIEKQAHRIGELERQISEQEECFIKATTDSAKELTSKEEKIQEERMRLEEERNLLNKQKDALMEGRDETELNLLRATEELANEKQLLMERHQKERDRLENAARQLEEAMEQEVKVTEDKEVAYLAQIDDLTSQIESLKKQRESGSRFTAELTTDREVERDQFEKEMEAMRNEIDQARDTAKAESLLAEKVSHLEEDLCLKEQIQDESAEEIEKLKEEIKRQENEINELQDRVSEKELEGQKMEIISTKSALEESQQQQEVLQQELYANMLRISALEAQLDRYRHGIDEDAIAAIERAEAEEKRMKEQGKEDLEVKENEIEQLVDQQNMLRTQIIEKEEQVEKLLQALENVKEIEAENIKLKDELHQAELANSQRLSSSEQLEALSHHLLEEKNVEIDELRQQVALLHSDNVDGETSHQILASLQERIRELVSENEELKNKLENVDVVEAPRQVEVDKNDPGDDDTGIHELTSGDLTHHEDAGRIALFQEENLHLRQELEKARKNAEDLLSTIGRDVFNIPPGLKERICDLEERLDKEKDDHQSSDSSSEEEECIIEDNSNKLHKEDEEKSRRTKDSNIIREKLMEIEEELKLLHCSVIGRILCDKDDVIATNKFIIERLQNDVCDKQKKVDDLSKQVVELEHELKEPDVRIRMNGGDEAIKMEQDEPANKEITSDDHSMKDSSSSDDDVESLSDLKASHDLSHDDEASHDLSRNDDTSHDLSHDDEASHVLSHDEEASHDLSHDDEATHDLSHDDEASHDLSHDDEASHDLSHDDEASHDLSHDDEATHDLSHDDEATHDLSHDDDTSHEELCDKDASCDESASHHEDEEEMMLVTKQQEIHDRDDIISERNQIIENNKKKLDELVGKLKESEEKCEQLEVDINKKCEQLQSEFDVYKSMHPDDDDLVLDLPIVRDEIEKLKGELDKIEKRASSSCEERDRISKQLDDVQRECGSLLDDNHCLEEEKRSLEDGISDNASRVHDLEDVIQEREAELQQAQHVAAESQKLALEASRELDGLQMVAEETANGRNMLQIELNELTQEYEKILKQLREVSEKSNNEVPNDGSGDHIHSELFTNDIEHGDSVEVMRLAEENNALHEEINNLTFKTEELEFELENMKQIHVDECNNLNVQHEQELSQLKQNLHESTRINLEDDLQQSPDVQLVRLPSMESQSSSEDLQEQIEEVKKNHHIKMEEIKNKYSRELEEAVAMATKEQEERNEEKLSELQEKHRRELSELLSESLNGDNELAQRLRNELDLADKLDHELINQLTSVTQTTDDKHTEDDSVNSSPVKSSEISSRLQHLLSRLHNEGVQVLSLSELQFLKQHQSLRNTPTNTEPEEIPTKSFTDIEGLKQAWESEKLALLDAIQALKELLTQTASEAAQYTDDDESLKWRGDLLRSVADLFERERHALLAELRANVIEAHGEAELNSELSAASRLESLERKIRSQDLQHRSELERLLAADRDQLVDDVKQLKVERKEKLQQAFDRIQQLQDQHKMAEENHRQTINQLQNQLDCMKSRVQQEEAVTRDLRGSLETEKQRSLEMLPALQRERERTYELSSELANLSERSGREILSANQHVETLKRELDDVSKKLDESESKVKSMKEESKEREEMFEEESEKQEKLLEKNEETITELQEALLSEERRRDEAMKAVEVEQNNVASLHQALASERATAYDDVIKLKNRCDEFASAVKAEKGRCEELQSALEQEATLTRHARLELENERKMTLQARAHDRATVADLQAILEDAKQETERVQKRVEVAEEEREEAIKRAEEEKQLMSEKLEQERASRDESLKREQTARSELQSALETEKFHKHDAQRRVQELEGRQKHLIRQQIPSPRETQETLLGHRRQLESLRQRLQLEASKLQNLVVRPSHRMSHGDHDLPSSSLLSSDGEKVESLKRSLQDMQGELKDLHTSLTFLDRSGDVSVQPIKFNDNLLQQNAELSDYAATSAKEASELRDAMSALQEEQKRGIQNDENMQNQQKMASRMHKLYTRYLRAESFRKSLVYQKKYLLLLLGGFQDCEEATLALIARMGAYPSDDSLRRRTAHRSTAFTKFRSAVRVVIAVCRLKFLVRKWKRANNTVSTAIQSKHGLPNRNGSTSRTKVDSLSPYPRSISRTPSPLYEPSPQYDPIASPSVRPHTHEPMTSQNSYSRYSSEPPSRDISPYASRSYRPTHDLSYDAPHGFMNRDMRDSAVDRSLPAESDPSLNEYIQKLENIQHKLKYPR